jgi:hypothetical protein
VGLADLYRRFRVGFPALCLAIAWLNIRHTLGPSRLPAATPKPMIRRVKMSITTKTQ